MTHIHKFQGMINGHRSYGSVYISQCINCLAVQVVQEWIEPDAKVVNGKYVKSKRRRTVPNVSEQTIWHS